MAKKRNNHNRSLFFAFLVGLGTTIIDQIVHVASDFTHQIFFLPQVETTYYIGIKFFLFFITAFIFLNLKKPKNPIIKATIISIIPAGIFGVILSIMFPGQYNFFWHLFHAFAGFVPAIIAVLMFRGEK